MKCYCLWMSASHEIVHTLRISTISLNLKTVVSRGMEFVVFGVEEPALLFRAHSLGDIGRTTRTAPQSFSDKLTELSEIDVTFVNIQLFTDEKLCWRNCYHS